jgi:hypothetical protein
LAEIDIEAEKTKYEAELNQFITQLQQIEQQRTVLIQAIAERRGILAFLSSLNEHKSGEIEKPAT